jgi:DNA-binding transcriptional ArsR family regulator
MCPQRIRYTICMKSYPLAAMADLIADPGRAAMLVSLLDRSARPATELARIAGVSQQSASLHLSKLLNGGLVTVTPEGRHRYYRISSPEVGLALEALGSIASIQSKAEQRHRTEDERLREIRSCYDHMAGRVAVEFADALQQKKVIVDDGESNFILTSKGERWFLEMGVNAMELRRSKRHLARRCLDWTERRPHLAGSLGAALLDRLEQMRLMARTPGTRALRITRKGSVWLLALGIQCQPRRS